METKKIQFKDLSDPLMATVIAVWLYLVAFLLGIIAMIISHSPYN